MSLDFAAALQVSRKEAPQVAFLNELHFWSIWWKILDEEEGKTCWKNWPQFFSTEHATENKRVFVEDNVKSMNRLTLGDKHKMLPKSFLQAVQSLKIQQHGGETLGEPVSRSTKIHWTSWLKGYQCQIFAIRPIFHYNAHLQAIVAQFLGSLFTVFSS